MNEIILLVLLLFLGRVINSKRLERFIFIKTLAVFVAMLFFSTTVFLILVFGLLLISQYIVTPLGKSPFMTMFMLILVSGVILYFLVSKLANKWHISMTIFTLIEYYIQWGLIYITLYQVAIDNFIKGTDIGTDIEKLIEGGVSSPAYLMLAFLPSLISVWIATIMYKLEKHEI
ncbi:hypothetical protein QUV97_03045 [Enterococcus cecorum]|uniref:SA1002 family membrane protein n=1 Tax=Enterococcus cecorum TaxID=44008 RepID=UPI0025A3317E|nr:hypothetical protein [Enterococcus cecorum]MDM8182638.1 hypothetical protein [Enterococcus cecorum]